METGDLNPEEREDLQTIIRKAERLQELITQFYEYTKVTSTDYSLSLENIEVTKLLREALADAYPELEKRQLEVEVNIPQGPLEIRGNVNAMQRVLQNLLQNAVRYAKSYLEVIVSEEEGAVEIIFANDVEDLNVSDVERLFERFYTPDASRTQGSTGLGLTIAKEFVEKMKGTMEAELVGEKLRIVMRFSK
jgi:signal transduction histidine kinase